MSSSSSCRRVLFKEPGESNALARCRDHLLGVVLVGFGQLDSGAQSRHRIPGDHMMHESEKRSRVLYPWSQLGVQRFIETQCSPVAMLAGVGFWLGLVAVASRPSHHTGTGTVPSISCPERYGNPILEELLFRGYCQGQLRQQSWGQQGWGGLTCGE